MTRHEPSRSSWTRAGEIADHVGPHRRAAESPSRKSSRTAAARLARHSYARRRYPPDCERSSLHGGQGPLRRGCERPAGAEEERLQIGVHPVGRGLKEDAPVPVVVHAAPLSRSGR
jgi:hypothetical protein